MIVNFHGWSNALLLEDAACSRTRANLRRRIEYVGSGGCKLLAPSAIIGSVIIISCLSKKKKKKKKSSSLVIIISIALLYSSCCLGLGLRLAIVCH